MSTIVDVARLADVSRTTVTRVLNEPEKVKKTTQSRVEKAIKELNYSPNFSARSLVSKTSGIIGLLLPNNESGFFGSVMSTVHKKVNESGRMLMVLEGQGIEEESNAIRKFSDINCDGYILYSRYLPYKDIFTYTKEKPLALIDRHDAERNSVFFDHFTAAFELIQKLIDVGHKKIGIVAGPKDRKNALARVEGCKAALMQSGLTLPDSRLKQGAYDNQFGMMATEQLLSQHSNITAIVYCGERACAGGLKILRTKGVQIPDDISVVSFDSYNLTEFLVPHIDSVVYPVKEMAELAAEKVLVQLANKNLVTQSSQIPHHFILGESIKAIR